MYNKLKIQVSTATIELLFVNEGILPPNFPQNYESQTAFTKLLTNYSLHISNRYTEILIHVEDALRNT
jgi:hypothetical protein